MSNKNNGGPAFPTTPGNYINENSLGEGMTLRDYFAAKALMGMLSNEGCNPFHEFGFNGKAWARKSYEIADAMLEARK